MYGNDSDMLSLTMACFGITNSLAQNFAVRFIPSVLTVLKCVRKLDVFLTELYNVLMSSLRAIVICQITSELL